MEVEGEGEGGGEIGRNGVLSLLLFLLHVMLEWKEKRRMRGGEGRREEGEKEDERRRGRRNDRLCVCVLLLYRYSLHMMLECRDVKGEAMEASPSRTSCGSTDASSSFFIKSRSFC